MNREALLQAWLREEEAAHIHGWDFSHLHGRYAEEGDLPWDYREVVRHYLRPDTRLLDLDTGGGEFLLSLGHPPRLTAATENYPPNAALCRERMLRREIPMEPHDRSVPWVLTERGLYEDGVPVQR